MKKLSIIVPVYNVEKYLSKCLDSLINQDIPVDEYEIIIVNDESPDNSLLIAEEYSKKYKNISIISQKNKGLGGARNTGIRAARGKYLLFVDSDDYIEKNCLQLLLHNIEKDSLQVLRFNYESVNENGNIIPKKKNALYGVVWDDEIISGEEFLANKLGWVCTVWAFLFDTSMIKQHELYFDESIYLEDVEWIYRVFEKAERVKSIHTLIYYYLQREGSILHPQNTARIRKLSNDQLQIIETFQTLALNKRRNQWYKGMIAFSTVSLLGNVSNLFYNERRIYIDKLKKMKVYPLSYHNMTLKQRLNILVCNISPSLYCWIKWKSSREFLK